MVTGRKLEKEPASQLKSAMCCNINYFQLLCKKTLFKILPKTKRYCCNLNSNLGLLVIKD